MRTWLSAITAGCLPVSKSSIIRWFYALREDNLLCLRRVRLSPPPTQIITFRLSNLAGDWF
jgi:hypothetical protein